MITKQDKARIAGLVTSDTYRVLQQIAQDLIAEWANQKIGANEQFTYLKEAIGREKKGEGIATFLNYLEDLTKSQ